MISLNDLNALKIYTEVQANILKERPMYMITEGDVVTWKNISDVLDIEALSVGAKIETNSIFYKAASQNKVMTEEFPRTVYGKRVLVNVVPIVNEAGEAVGTFSTFYRRLHPTLAAFDHFAPLLAEMFPGGVLLYTTNLKTFTRRQPSKLFDLPAVQVGDTIKEGDIALKSIQTKKSTVVEFDAGKYGTPVVVVNYPLFNEEGTELVGTFGMIIPKKISFQLRSMSENLSNGLDGISAAIEELTASASQIHENEQVLNTDIKGIISLSDEINNVSVFIREIADETKMLGLNAAIEAARAGDAGRGFGVVADEIRKLSEQSKSTVPQIKELTDNIKASIDKVIEKSNSSLHSSEEQAAASQEITASIEEITSMAEELNGIAIQL
jgi:hypothetical protein